ncbi:MAG: hypothetical protein QGI60_00410 [archaeon]|jgi:hypothetical protein|nr:hypothetical protein [archaeon]
MVHFHLGKILKIIKPDKDVISSDSSVQVIVEMWDENQMVLGVEAGIARQIKVHDVVLVDYNPLPGVAQPIPKQQIVKIVRGKQGKDCWELFKKYHAEKKNKSGEDPQAPGISYSR